MELPQPTSSAGYCQDCSELISTMLKGGGLFKPTSLVSDPANGWCLWPISPNCNICKMMSSAVTRSVIQWTPSLIEIHPPDTVRVIPKHGRQAEIRVVTGFKAISAAGPVFDFSIWSKNGEVLIPSTAESDKNDDIGSDQPYLPITAIPPLGINYGKSHFDMMRSWLETCHNHHESCKKSDALVVDENKQTLLPTRLIDISCIKEDMVALVNTSGTRGNYCALSYCWGQEADKHIRTTRETLFNHQAGIKIDRLPQVFKDAIRVTHEIGLRYLWVDSLCIIQDDKQDWNAEASRMFEVYRNADLVIAAAGASNPSEGCFMKRDMPNSPEIQVSMVPDMENPGEVKSIWLQQALSGREPSDGPLKKRGWTLQEAWLARRSIHFMPDGMHWQRQELHTNERTSTNPAIERGGWLELLYFFSQRRLTKKEDRLVAIQGLVNEFQRDLGPDFHYHKGIFTCGIPEQILWSMSKTYTYDDPPAIETWEDPPSWSWARKSGSKWFWFGGSGLEYSLQADKSKVELALTSDDLLRFTGYSATCQVVAFVDEDDSQRDDYENAVIDTAASWRVKELYGMTHLDGTTEQAVGFAAPDSTTLRNVTVLFIAQRTWSSIEQEREHGFSSVRNPQYPSLSNPPSSKVYIGLLVVPSTNKEGIFQRVGLCLVLRDPEEIGKQATIIIE